MKDGDRLVNRRFGEEIRGSHRTFNSQSDRFQFAILQTFENKFAVGRHAIARDWRSRVRKRPLGVKSKENGLVAISDPDSNMVIRRVRI